MRVFIKLGGSFITDKQQEGVFRPALVQQFADDLNSALSENPNLEVLIGHGSGSFGHVAAKRYGTITGVHSREEWLGFARVAHVAADLNHLVVKILEDAGLPVLRVQPSASLVAVDGVVKSMAVNSIERALASALIPVVYGDVAFDDVRGGTIISTEALFFYLAERLGVDQILLLGEVEGVYDALGAVIPSITPATFSSVQGLLSGSHGTDVTGGMSSKVRDMVALVERLPRVSIRILSGLHAGAVQEVLSSRSFVGTSIVSS